MVVNSTGGYNLGEYPCGPIVADYLWACRKSFSFTILRPILHLWNAKPGNYTGIIGNLKRIIGSFWKNKRIE